jgi:hypothetical protein
MNHFLNIALLSCSLVGAGPALGSGQWQQRVQSYVDAYEKSAEAPKPIVYPQLAERVRQQFPAQGVVRVSWSRRQGDGTVVEGELYSRPGELFVVQKTEGWNLVTKGNYVYEWRVGTTTGIKIDKIESDLVDYSLYLTDPALLMTGIYYKYLVEPEHFLREAADVDGVITLRLKKPIEGFESLSITERPFCFRGFSFTNPVSQTSGAFVISAPEIVHEVPAAVIERMKSIRFKTSEKSLKRHMTYL